MHSPTSLYFNSVSRSVPLKRVVGNIEVCPSVSYLSPFLLAILFSMVIHFPAVVKQKVFAFTNKDESRNEIIFKMRRKI